MNQEQLKIIYMAMMQVARTEATDEQLEKYEELSDDIINYHDFSVSDVIDNLETVYNLIDKSVYDQWKD
ncbi:hypothetical protein FZC83_02210 [Rossellomorea marisflavi]|uniref:Uncharacterized protein n=1 Tax=Rossellomorea marisflavi TaxID=189381 RepID=A0A5D4RZM0_9BACI|nr:hypothetical protein [Rossellomorea marisflavi]TYS56410.1 hypothetical protein FZC83_02210 [Rossellomorea marisflavi]